MAADIVMKANDRLPTVQAQLFVGGTPASLTGATVAFIMRPKNGGAVKVNSAAVIVSAADGVVRYDWAAADTNTPGDYRAEWEVTFADGKTQTFPTAGHHSVQIVEDLDGA